MDQMRILFLSTLRFSADREHQQDATKPWHSDEVVDSKTLDFSTFTADADREL